MRDIRFRAWDNDLNVYLYDVQAKQGYLFRDFINNERFILEQYTGLKDKNGVEVYEGDIVKTKYDGHPPVSIDWKDGGFYYSPVKKDKHGNLFCVCEFTVGEDEVIGNIHENKKLLETK